MKISDERTIVYQRPPESANAFGLVGLVLVIALVLFTTWRGLDFGDHHDEPELVGAVRISCQTGVLLPGYYYKPSLPFELSLVGLIVPIAEFAHSDGLPEFSPSKIVAWGRQLRSRLNNYCSSPQFLLVNRFLFALVSSASLIWVYLLVAYWRNNAIEALLASAILGLSWEVAYHIRWVAADGLMMQFGALTILLLMIQEIKSPVSQGPIKWASFVAGLTTGTKYTAALLIVPILLVALTARRETGSFRARLEPVKAVVGLFLAGYLLSTPGTLVDPGRFYTGIVLQETVYAHGHNAVHNVGIGFDHLARMLNYFLGAVSSPFSIPCYFLAALGMVGLASVIRQDSRHALAFLLFPLLYILLIAVHRVMFVRNLLILIPVWAILCARGVFFLSDRFRANRHFVRILAAAVTVCLGANAFWIVYAGELIHHRSLEADLRQFVTYVQEGSRDVGTSEPLAQELKQAGLIARPRRGGGDAREPALIAFRRFEVDWKLPQLKWRNNITARFGPYDANLEYYPDNKGHNHILVMPRADALLLGILEHRARTERR